MRQILTIDVDDTGAYAIVRADADPPVEVHVFPSQYDVGEWVIYEPLLPRKASRSSTRRYRTEQEALLNGMQAARGLLDEEESDD
jgi:hypothetical protein